MMTGDSIPAALQQALLELPKGLYEHIQRTRQVARELATLSGVDVGKVDLAAAAHDLARAMEGETLLVEAARLGIAVSPVEAAVPILLHGPVAAERLRQELAIADSGVLEAVRWHTTARAGLGRVAQVVFLADKLDPEKVAANPHRERVKALAQSSLERAMLEYLTHELEGLLKQGALIHPASIEARNDLLSKLHRRPS
ncbi:MAG: bis(5'-nucleosyl)-tetraphosphatase (symmetrical) YqeK [Chloroflexi bacterium]|nr:bis(5'-nucleosyl)-tetraphosphatase (symmetrical) YqeK [Chloroflexota bacterium]